MWLGDANARDLAGVRPSARISTVAQLLDLDQTQVRRLVDTGQLQAHRIGKRGIRVFLDLGGPVPGAQQHDPSRGEGADRESSKVRRLSADHHRAVARLKEVGILPK